MKFFVLILKAFADGVNTTPEEVECNNPNFTLTGQPFFTLLFMQLSQHDCEWYFFSIEL